MARHNDNEGAEAAPHSRYDDELLSANWNPVIDLLGASCAKTREETSRSPSYEAAPEDPDTFLRRIYKLGS